MSTNTYLQRRDARLLFERLKREIVFGMAMSTLLLVVGGWRYFMVVGANDSLWAGGAMLGILGFAAAILFPALWRRPEQVFSAIMRPVGEWLFAAVLAVVYVLLFAPVGWVLRSLKGLDPIYAWHDSVPAVMEGWRHKEVLSESNIGRSGRPNLAKRLFGVIRFFAGRGHYVFLPALVVLMALGMVLFFVQTSALAPFIYTLF